MTDDYEWQTKVIEKWLKNGRKGVLQAVPGAGKTRAGVRIVQHVFEEKKDASVLILAPTLQIMKQWGDALAEVGLQEDEEHLRIRTYFWASKLSEREHFAFDLIVFDECHSLLSDVRAKAFNLKKNAYIGMSATPGGSENFLGGIFLGVDWDEANIAPFTIKYVRFDLEEGEAETHARLTKEVKRVMANQDIPEEQRMIVIMKRRSFVYNLPKRTDLVVQLVREHPDERIIIFAERLEQVSQISAKLFAHGFANAIYTSETDTIDMFKTGDVNILVTSKMVKEGYNDPSTTLGIIASTPLTERNQVQTVGRIIRFFPDKVANIYILLARETSDDKLLKGGMDGVIINHEDDIAIDPSEKYFLRLMGVTG